MRPFYVGLMIWAPIQASSSFDPTLRPPEQNGEPDCNGIRGQPFLGDLARAWQREHRSAARAARCLSRDRSRPRILHWIALLAEAYRDTGEPERGLRVITEALDHAAQTGIVYYEAELHRLEAELGLRLDTPDEQRAETSFRRALEIARRQQAKSWELRAATSLARLWGERGRRTEARDLLAPVYDWFTEGFDTADLKQAQALLNQLA